MYGSTLHVGFSAVKTPSVVFVRSTRRHLVVPSMPRAAMPDASVTRRHGHARSLGVLPHLDPPHGIRYFRYDLFAIPNTLVVNAAAFAKCFGEMKRC